MRRLARFALVFALIQGVTYAAGQALRRLYPPHGDEDSDEVALTIVQGGLEFRSRARAFEGGRILTVMGGAMVDLSGAEMDPAGAFLDLRTFMGGIDLVVPEHWRVEYTSKAYAGGLDDRTVHDGPPATAPLLTITAFTVMGGVAIRPRKAAQAAPQPSATQ